MLRGVLAFLVHWLALSGWGGGGPPPQAWPPMQISQAHFAGPGGGHSTPPFAQRTSHWGLLSDLQELPEEELESYLPQLCNLVLDRAGLDDPALFDFFERILQTKCADCLPFGTRLCNTLKAMAPSQRVGLLKTVLAGGAAERKDEALRRLQEQAELYTLHGRGLPPPVAAQRAEYAADLQFLLDSLARLGLELQSSPLPQRARQLRQGLAELNQLLFFRMIVRQPFARLQPGSARPEADIYAPPPQPAQPAQSTELFAAAGFGFGGIDAGAVAARCPSVAAHSLHMPLLHAHSHVFRLLRFLEHDSELLPSRDKAPFLVLAELLEEPTHRVKSAALYLPDADAQSWPAYSQSLETIDAAKALEEAPAEAAGAGAGVGNLRLFAREDVSPAQAKRLRQLEAFAVEEADPPPCPQATHGPRDEEGDEDGGPAQLDLGGDPGPGPSPVTSTRRPRRRPGSPPPQTFPSLLPGGAGPRALVPGGNGGGLPSWRERKRFLRARSPFGHLPGYTVKAFIVKAGDDLGKEALALQLVARMAQIFREERVDAFLRSYQVLPTGPRCGLVEFLEDSPSIDRLKKAAGGGADLRALFRLQFGEPAGLAHQAAVLNFARSLAGYSLLTYLAQVKDRHNANILLDPRGHLVHIDFGFALGDSPGFNLNFESAPFKLTQEYVDLLGGLDSPNFRAFEDLFVRGFQALQRHTDELCALVQLFYGDRRRADALRARLMFPQTAADVLGLVSDSLDNWRTKQYDWFQLQSNNIQM